MNGHSIVGVASCCRPATGQLVMVHEVRMGGRTTSDPSLSGHLRCLGGLDMQLPAYKSSEQLAIPPAGTKVRQPLPYHRSDTAKESIFFILVL